MASDPTPTMGVRTTTPIQITKITTTDPSAFTFETRAESGTHAPEAVDPVVRGRSPLERVPDLTPFALTGPEVCSNCLGNKDSQWI